jgi:serine/threonine-protein kinase
LAFGRFRVVHQIGAGVLGPVFRGDDPERDRTVAIKAFALDLTPEQAADLAVGLQPLTAPAIAHPAVIPVFECGVDGSTAFLVQEYFAADSADVALKQFGPPSPDDAPRLVGQLAGGLDAAAAAGVHHGALHLRDVLVAPGEIRLTGLGVVPALERVGFHPPVRRPYAAPERLAGGPATLASDVYSLACLASELLTGRRPVPAGDGVTVETAGIEAADADALAEAFARALSERPQDRHGSALAFAAALKHALTGEPLREGADTGRAKVRRPKGRKLPATGLAASHPSLLDTPGQQPGGLESIGGRDAPVETTDRESSDAASGGRPRPGFQAESLPQPELGAEPEPGVGSARGSRFNRSLPLEPAAVAPASDPLDVALADRELVTPPPEEAARPGRASGRPAEVEPAARRRSAALPLATLLVGLAVGFGAGYLVAPRGSATAVPTASSAGSSAPAAPAAVTTPAPTGEPAAAAQAGPISASTAQAAPVADTASLPVVETAQEGTLIVVSRPAGALVRLDGREAGRTPLTIEHLQAGPHKVRLELAGYRPSVSTTLVGAGARVRIVRTLKRRIGG